MRALEQKKPFSQLEEDNRVFFSRCVISLEVGRAGEAERKNITSKLQEEASQERPSLVVFTPHKWKSSESSKFTSRARHFPCGNCDFMSSIRRQQFSLKMFNFGQ